MVDVIDPIAPDGDVTPEDTPAAKPGWQTTEFWLSLAAVIVAFLQTQQVFEEGSIWANGLATVATVLAALGYAASRAIVKRSRIQAQNDLTLARLKARVEMHKAD